MQYSSSPNELKKLIINITAVTVEVFLREEGYMKKNVITILSVILIGTSGLAIAQMNDKGKEMMGGKSGMMGMCPMMNSMMGRSVVATSDGGVVIVTGNKLTKYDKDLNVVKEVELKMDMEGMQKMMDNMKSMCPMMGKGMKEGMSKKDDDDDDEAAEAAEKAEHESHHPENK